MGNLLSERFLSRILLTTAAVLAFLFVLLFVYENLRLDEIRENWDRLFADEKEKRSAEVTGAFDMFQNGIVSATTSAAGSLRNLIGPGQERGTPADIFAVLDAGHPPDLSLELYDTDSHVAAWRGPGGPPIAGEFLRNVPVSFIVDGPIYSYLAVSIPVYTDNNPAGHIVGKRLFDVSHPVNNRFVSDRALAVSFASILDPDGGSGVQFRVNTESGAAPEDGFTMMVPLRSIGGNEIAYAALPVPTLQVYLEESETLFTRWKTGVAVSLLSVLLWIACRFVQKKREWKEWGFYCGLASLWVVRYALIWTDVPDCFVTSELFSPSLFASAFGDGAARSLGDMLLSAVVLGITTLAIFHRVHERVGVSESVPRGGGASAMGGGRNRFLHAAGVVVLVGLLGPLSRALYAIIRSAVFDSRIDLNDPKIVFPGLEMAVLLLGIFILILSAILAGIIFIFLSRQMIARLSGRLSNGMAWLIVFLLTVVSSLLFDLLHTNPLGSPVERLFILGGVCLLALLSDVRRNRRRPSAAQGTVLITALITIAVFVPLLDEKVHEHDKSLVETVVRDLARPEDAWMNFLMNEALDDMSGDFAADVLRGGDYAAGEKLAFTSWAGSVLGREGNNCSVTYIDLEGSVVSFFHVGVAPHWSREHHMDEMPRSTRNIGKEFRTLRGKLSTWYKGYAPVFTADTQFVGGVWIGISPIGPEKILGQEYDLLTTSRKFEHGSRVREVMLTEYTDGRMSYSSNEDIPFGRSLEEVIPGGEVPPAGVWVEEEFSGKSHESFYLQRSESAILGVGIRSLDATWHFYSYSRYILFFFAFLLVAGIILVVRKAVDPRQRAVTFRAKLIMAFAIVSVIPVVLLAYYNRASLIRDADMGTQSFLRSETELVVNEVQDRLGMTVPYELSLLDDESLEEIAARINTEFYLFGEERVQASSRPELFAAELIDRRMSSGSYVNLNLLGKNFFAERQTIGTIAYLVGYRPLRAQSGEVIGAVAVPTLFRQGEVEENIAREAVVLYGIYIVVLGVSLLIGTLLANQIARPLRRLIGASRRVATGDLDVRIESDRTDEIGELESAFNSMTTDLRGVQDKMKRVEREMAWKEMARQVAHEIKNPLTPMRLSVQHLVSAYRDRAADFGALLRTVSATMLEQIDSLSRIASEFSSFARFPERKPESVDLHEIIMEAAALYDREKVEIRTSFTPDKVIITADREEFRRAFINIIRNSAQAAPSGVTIEISTRVAGGSVKISVTDNGPGVAEDIQSRLFEPNFSTKTDGMGIGLTIVKKTIEETGGTITLESTPGKGTTILIRIPLADANSR